MRRLVLLLPLFLVLGAGHASAQETSRPTLYRDLAYADISEAQKLDLYVPVTGEGPFPLVIYIHGGGWVSGDKSRVQSIGGVAFIDGGYAVASINYRLSGEAPFPAQIEDVKAAVRWLRANAAEYNLDPERFAAWGSSAGGHLAALLGTSGDVAEFDNPELGNADVSSRVQAVIDWYGPTDLPRFAEDLNTSEVCPPASDADTARDNFTLFMGDVPSAVPERMLAASSTTYVSADDPPFWIQHGSHDCLVPMQQSEHLYDALVDAIGEDNVQLTLFEGAGHGGRDFFEPANYDLLIAFLDEVLAE